MTKATSERQPASFLRRSLAALYDLLIVAALWMLVGAVFVLINDGEAVGSADRSLQAGLALMAALFYVSSWRLGGQTPGMKAWRIRVTGPDGAPPGWQIATLRFVAAAIGLAVIGIGHLWALIDPSGRCAHDRLTGTKVVHEPRLPGSQ
jgi:uncharacterized RDD family membrane protein YckC